MNDRSPKILWGTLPTPKAIVAPVAILKLQAEALSKITQGQLVGEVVRHNNSQLGICNVFVIRVPALGNYTARICLIDHGPLLYPVDLRGLLVEHEASCLDQEEFEEELGSFLNCRPILDFIQGLLSAAAASAD